MTGVMADGTDPSDFEIYVMSDGLLLVHLRCDTNLLRTDQDLLLLDLTDAARTHVCDPRKVAAVEEMDRKRKTPTGG